MPKVVRTILNRIHDRQPAAVRLDQLLRLQAGGHAGDKCIYDQVDSPYNTYTHQGLPPSPIDNPGAPAMTAAVQPAKGDYLYFVNVDAAGHLGFFRSEKDFEAAREKCVKHHWGCG